MKINLDKIKANKPTEDLIKFGIINIDKPSGPTSFTVSQFVKDSLKINKTSHFGTLDPGVSGVLPVALGRACRLNDYFMHRDKTYIGIMRLHKEISDKDIQEISRKFLGKIKQTPPVRSSVKRAERIREVKTFKILERNERDILFETKVQAGTYIRKLCDDIGKEIGGAHMLELRRIEAGIFKEKESVDLYQFDKAVKAWQGGNDSLIREIIMPAEIVSQVMPVLEIKKEFVNKILAGSPIFESFLESKEEVKDLREGEKICLFSEKGFIGCYNFIGGKEIIARPEFVLN